MSFEHSLYDFRKTRPGRRTRPVQLIRRKKLEMKTIISLSKVGISALVLVILLSVSAAGVFAQGGTTAPQTPAPGPSQAETAAIDKVKNAADANAAMAAATEYIKAFPTSTQRGEVGDIVAGKIAAITDATQKAAISEKMMTLFNGVDEADGLFDALDAAKNYDEMFRLGAIRLQTVPGEVKILTSLALTGSNMLRQNNKKYAAQTEQYGLKAIALIEAGQKPTAMPDSEWTVYKTKYLPPLYQTVGMIVFSKKDMTGAQKLFQKALAIDSRDALTYNMLADISDDQYQDAAGQYKANPNDLALKKAINLMDQTIDLYIHAVAFSEGNPALAEIHKHALSSLETYYKFRHNGSTAGMQEEIDKLKKPAVNP